MPKIINLDVSVWYDEEDGQFRLATRDGAGFVTTIGSDPDAMRGRSNLFLEACQIA